MNIILNENSIGSRLLKNKFESENIDIYELVEYLTILIKFIILNTKMDTKLCIYSLCGKYLVNLGEVFLSLYINDIFLNTKAQILYNKEIKSKILYDKDDNYFDYIGQEMLENAGIDMYELGSQILRENIDEIKDKGLGRFRNYDYTGDKHKKYVSKWARKWDISNKHIDILNRLEKGLTNRDLRVLYENILPRNIIEVEIINTNIDYIKYANNTYVTLYNVLKYNRDSIEELLEKRYFLIQNSPIWLNKKDWLKIGRVCEFCDISPYEERNLFVNDNLKFNNYNTVYDRIDRCLMDKYQGSYTIKSRDGITYGELAKAIKMASTSKFIPPVEYKGVKELELIPTNIPRKFKLKIKLELIPDITRPY